ncbi:MAG: substrate-binding domain-containing protein [Pseudomonadota bacterium]
MIKQQRQKRILSILSSEGAVEIAELARIMPEVSRVTLRRDMADLAEQGALRRTHGGALLPDAVVLSHPAVHGSAGHETQVTFAIEDLDAVILPPVSGRGGDALRRHIARRGIPFLAESAPQAGGRYLGPDNLQAGLELGRLAGQDAGDAPDLRVLIVGHPDLANTRDRAAGFQAGLREGFDGDVAVVAVNGQGAYRTATRVIADAMATSEPFDLIFAVNDHSAIAAAELSERAGRAAAIYATGGEAADFVASVAEDGPIRAVAAFFPEVVGDRAIDMVARALRGEEETGDEATPHVIITAETLEEYFERVDGGWRLSPTRRAELSGVPVSARALGGRVRIGFMPHYPAHDWYRTMILAMQARAREAGFDLVISPPHHSIAAEISRLRAQIACAACEGLEAGETILIGDGEATLSLAGEIRRIAFDDPSRVSGLTVITNALDVLFRLDGAPGIKTILTSGEYQSTDRCLVGPSLGALFERVRADRAFLSVSGVSTRFGISSMDERLALAGSRFVEAARQTIVLADHTQIGTDANHRIARIDDVHAVITDDGAVPADRQSLRSAGVDVLVAADDGDTPQSQRADAATRRAGKR